MPNIGAVLKEEIVRLSRRELTAQMQSTKKASSQQRTSIATLKRQVAALERQVAALLRQRPKAPTPETTSTAPKSRFVAKGLKSLRARLGLSAADFGKLAGVSAQSIYNWEQGHSAPGPKQLAIISKLRTMGKRQAQAQLHARV
ncbi:MAG: helix-turn-helix domain-containing protein [Planctomycetota bacterium]